ncbi:helix-turn-helix domain-containing protein [Oerskovia sp. Root22]|uniref:helix-turn-helix domain-containing protein n=1 Tax=Oerskovia sp. Root22 TaxID=1736494 RepID=UPI0009EC49A5|nr:helix-turn-helix domain-containing protein [Oerskovia sp. Root22]
MKDTPDDSELLLGPREVARLLGVTPRTVARLSRDGILSTTRTSGGHRRFRLDEVYALLKSGDAIRDSEQQKSAQRSPSPEARRAP